MYHILLNENTYDECIDFQNDYLDEKSSDNISILNCDLFNSVNIIPIDRVSEDDLLESPQNLPSVNFSDEELFFIKELGVSNSDKQQKHESKKRSTLSSSSKELIIQKKENYPSNIFNMNEDEREIKKKIEEKKVNNLLNEKRERENKTKRGRQNRTKKKKEHTGKDFDNILVKIQNHYLSFIIKFSNDVSSTVLGNEYKDIFKNIDRACKINIKYDYFNKIKSGPIENILKLDINNKYQYYSKDNNSVNFDKLCKKSIWLKNKYFKMNFLDLFNYYYNNGDLLEEVNIGGINVSLSKNTETFYHLKYKNIEQEESLLNVVKTAYFNGYDRLNPGIIFKTLKNKIN